MKEDLAQLVEIFSLRESPPASDSPSLLAEHLKVTLKRILRTLDGIPSKFVDIDTSFTDIDEEQAESFKSAVAILESPELLENLFELYRELNLYLIIRDKFGEAADWNLKEEFRGRLSTVITQSMHKLFSLTVM